MSKVSIQLPNSLHKRLRECASAEGTSIDQLISSAVAEKLAALLGTEYFQQRAKRGSRKKFEAALKTVPDVEPPEFDQLPKKTLQRAATEHNKKRKSARQSSS